MPPAAKGWQTYLAVLTEPRYLSSLLQTTALALAVTAVSLTLAAMVGLAWCSAEPASAAAACCWRCRRCRCRSPA
jgi:ABC-type sulfate transport system permease component